MQDGKSIDYSHVLGNYFFDPKEEAELAQGGTVKVRKSLKFFDIEQPKSSQEKSLIGMYVTNTNDNASGARDVYEIVDISGMDQWGSAVITLRKFGEMPKVERVMIPKQEPKVRTVEEWKNDLGNDAGWTLGGIGRIAYDFIERFSQRANMAVSIEEAQKRENLIWGVEHALKTVTNFTEDERNEGEALLQLLNETKS